jgi:hypothetical protein
MWNVWGSGEVHTVFWWGGLGERVYLEDLGVDGRICRYSAVCDSSR